MKPELDQQLVKDFPILYQQRYNYMSTTAMRWGFSCDDGWEPLIRRLSEKLETWNNKHLNSPTVATQVKEKFGTLRFYVSHQGEISKEDYRYLTNLINDAENESGVTCEKCGKPGKLRETGWLLTLCDECFEEWKERR